MNKERWSSWFKAPVLKTGEGNTSLGSNPSLSVNLALLEKYCGEVPKWLKGLPWKGSRSLIAARGFKSLFLRSLNGEIIMNFENKIVTINQSIHYVSNKR